jgi:hypothetical protein
LARTSAPEGWPRGGYPTRIAGNATFLTGTGGSCMNVNNCTQIGEYSATKTGNFK